MNFTMRAAAVAVLAMILSACGGGGGDGKNAGTGESNTAVDVVTGGGGNEAESNTDNDGGNNTSPDSTPPAEETPVLPPVTTPVVFPADLQTSVSAPNYPTFQARLFVLELNGFRQSQGLGLLAQNTYLDVASANHLNYIENNSDIDTLEFNPTYKRREFHVERNDRPGYTGVLVTDRAPYAGYNGAYVQESGGYGQGGGAFHVLNTMIDSVYQRVALVAQGVREIGIAMSPDFSQTLVATTGYAATPQRNASDYVGVFPIDGQEEVRHTTVAEAPNPFPETDPANFYNETGYPIHIASEASTTIKVNSFTITEDGASTALNARILTADNDPNRLLPKNIAFVVAKEPLNPETKYRVQFDGTIDGRPVTKTWSFTTASVG